jgi:hypothetical protein
MTSIARRFAAVFLASLAIAMPARATNYSIDLTDIWWAGQQESGWGVTISQQGSVLFSTFFIFGADRSARWFTAAMFPVASAAGTSAWSGDMFRSSGAFYGQATFNADPATDVGLATMTFTSANNATLVYTIDGVTVTKQITRQTFAGNSIAGAYTGGAVMDRSGCSNSSLNGIADVQGQVAITQNDPSVVISVAFADINGTASNCTFRGVYVPSGRLGSISGGTWSCVVGSTTVIQGTTFSMGNIDGQVNGLSSSFTGADQNQCQYAGRFGGIRNP